MVLVYATRAELVDYTPDEHKARIPTEPEATRLLTAASQEILINTRAAIYDTDTAGYPTDTDVRAAFRRATCAQALWWVLNKGEETGSSDEYTSVRIGSVSLTKAPSNASSGQSLGSSNSLAPRASTELTAAGLTPGAIVTSPRWRW